MKKILIVDDETLLVNMYKSALDTAGYEVSTAKDGAEGMKKIRSLMPDLVLLDIMMPEMTGMDILEKLKKDEKLKNIPVVMLTNLTWMDDKKSPITAGAEDIWIKADNKPAVLLKRVKKFLSK